MATTPTPPPSPTPPPTGPTSTAPAPDETSTDARQLLAVYLQDHHAAAGAGLALVRRCHRNNDGTEFERELGDLVANIASDADRLSDAMATLGVEPSRIKVVASQAGELVARLKSNGRLFDYSPTSRVLELEGLIAGLTAKRQLWHSLHAAEQDAFSRSELETLSARADEQIAVAEALHGLAARIAFGPTSR
jgi:hypothetical protein